jgi:hypothetical protein
MHTQQPVRLSLCDAAPHSPGHLMIPPYSSDVVVVLSAFACQSQLPRCLGHEPSSLARTLRSWVRTPLKAWMFGVYAFILFVMSCVYVQALRRADHSSKESYRL